MLSRGTRINRRNDPFSLATPITPLQIRPFVATDWPAVWALLEPVFRAGETFPHDPTISEGNARVAWVEQNQARRQGIGSRLGQHSLQAARRLWPTSGGR